jgi:hypothetical protein
VNPLDIVRRSGSGKQPNVNYTFGNHHRIDFMDFMGKPSFSKTPAMDTMAQELTAGHAWQFSPIESCDP